MIIYGVGKSSAELAALNGSLQDLLDGIQVLFSNYCLFMWKPSREPLAFAVVLWK